ncbi:hypothetical protein I3760_09G158100 [Carya illinoinensis]|nr:hypothetical protein I3760_09G158100 [Carya illinoinensis]
MMTGTDVVGKWGTWEELLLGGAVLRHGTRDWDVVSAELRTRLVCSYPFFTPEVCKSKFEDLQQRYYGCTAWFDELRKKRMAELRRALELSEGSIGSLESKLESLKAEKGDDCHAGYRSSQTESLVPFQERVESSGKEMSKDGLSAGSFTEEIQLNWSAECRIPVVVSAEEMETKPETSQPSEREKISSTEKLTETLYGGRGGSLRKRRGKRKRKDCSRDVKEGSVGESDFLGSVDVLTSLWCKEKATCNRGEVAESSGAGDFNKSLSKDGNDDLVGIYNSLLEDKNACVFLQRLDSQKRGRYKKMIRQHTDFNTIKSRIASHSITSASELFRDLLLLSNNSLVFYSKNTREYKSALLLRDIITQKLQQHFKYSHRTATPPNLSVKTLTPTRPVKPRSVRPGNCKASGKVADAGNAVTRTSNEGKKPSNDDSTEVESLAVTNKRFGRPRKGGRGSGNQRPVVPMKGRKRIRMRTFWCTKVYFFLLRSLLIKHCKNASYTHTTSKKES